MQACAEFRDLKSHDGLGNFVITLNARSLKTGDDYQLVVTEIGPRAREWRFAFAVER